MTIDIVHVLSLVLPTLALAPAVAHVWRSARTRPAPARTGGAGRIEPRLSDRDRVLATVLFVDMVGSTQRAASAGDRKWRALLETYHALVRDELRRYGGREIDAAGDGFVAAFDSPALAIGCARAIREVAASRRIAVRAGLHAGECEVMGAKLGGIAVHIGARVAGTAGAGEILVSRTVKDLVAGSELEFEDRGEHSLRGIPGEWRLHAVAR
jgi:class 3 adenylate cyclase